MMDQQKLEMIIMPAQWAEWFDPGYAKARLVTHQAAE
jgi:hypothetical protein